MTVKLCECGCGEPAPIAKKTRMSRGHTKGQPMRFRHGHGRWPHAGPRWRVEDRGYATPCLIWQWSIDTGGYGYGLLKDGTHNTAHRQAWIDAYGPIPDGLSVLHKCDVRTCGNPTHLFLGTLSDNMRDRDQKGRLARGERHGQAKLTQADVLAIRANAVIGESELARRYGVSNGCVYAVLRGHTWKHV